LPHKAQSEMSVEMSASLPLPPPQYLQLAQHEHRDQVPKNMQRLFPRANREMGQVVAMFIYHVYAVSSQRYVSSDDIWCCSEL